MKMANKVTAFLTGAAMALTLGVMPAANAMAAEYGDANLDGKVSIVDVIMVNKSVLGAETLSDEQRTVADVDGNGDVTAEDSLKILKFLVDLVDDLTPETTVPPVTEPTTTEATETTTATEATTTVATETNPVEPETTTAPAETTTTESEETTTESEETTTESEETTTESEETTADSEETTADSEETTTESEETTTESEETTTESEETTTESEETTTESEETTTESEETTTESEETTTESEETTTESEETTTESEETTTEGIASELAEVRETGTDTNGNKILDVSNATKVEIAVTGGDANAGMNGGFGYNEGEEWINLKWVITLDENGNGVAYVEVPEGQNSLQFQVWYYDGTSQDDLTFTFTVERDPDTVLVGETEVRELTVSEDDNKSYLDVTNAEKIEIAITGGIAFANTNGGFVYQDPTTGEWLTVTWSMTLDAEGNGAAYVAVPEGVTSMQFNNWYYGLGSETYDAAELNYTFTVQLASTETAE